MSSALATPAYRRPTAPFRAPSAPAPAPSIEIAPDRAQRRARPRVVYAAVVVGGVAALMCGQLLLSIALSDGAYTIDSLQSTQKEQARSVQQLTEDLGRLSSPQNLARNAEALGMVQDSSPVWLRLSDGSVIGTPTAAAAGAGLLAAGSQVPNELLDGVPLVATAPVGATPDAAAAGSGSAPVALQGR